MPRPLKFGDRGVHHSDLLNSTGESAQIATNQYRSSVGTEETVALRGGDA
jgi:hypothetical protein